MYKTKLSKKIKNFAEKIESLNMKSFEPVEMEQQKMEIFDKTVGPDAQLTLDYSYISANQMYIADGGQYKKSTLYSSWIEGFPMDKFEGKFDPTKPFKFKLGGALRVRMDWDNAIKPIQDMIARRLGLNDDKHIRFDGWLDNTHRCDSWKGEWIHIEIFQK